MTQKEINNIVRDQLNRLFQTDKEQYTEYLKNCKESGYRVFINDSGQHKVQWDKDYYKKAFGGIFA